VSIGCCRSWRLTFRLVELTGKYLSHRAAAKVSVGPGVRLCGGGCEGDGVAEGLELADVAAGPAADIGPGGVVAGAQFAVGG